MQDEVSQVDREIERVRRELAAHRAVASKADKMIQKSVEELRRLGARRAELLTFKLEI